MPQGPPCEKAPADVIGAAVTVAKIARGESTSPAMAAGLTDKLWDMATLCTSRTSIDRAQRVEVPPVVNFALIHCKQ
jgi:hypothetical protein